MDTSDLVGDQSEEELARVLSPDLPHEDILSSPPLPGKWK